MAVVLTILKITGAVLALKKESGAVLTTNRNTSVVHMQLKLIL